VETLLHVKRLKKYFPVSSGFFEKRKKFVHAVDDISFDVTKGETVGLVGESGSGKSTVGRTIMGLLKPTEGKILFDQDSIFQLDREKLRVIRRRMAIVFQDPYSSLNPRLRILDIVAEPLKTHMDSIGSGELEDKVAALLEHVGLSRKHFMRYPHEFSGGQRQRIAIARALALNPSFIVFDEPTSALDVSVQAQVLNLIADTQKEFRLTYLFISHNLAVVKHISNRIIIMYLGKIVEVGKTQDIFQDPLHPYSKALLSAIPFLDPDRHREEILLGGDVPSPIDVPSGCHFHARCQSVFERCYNDLPALREIKKGHWVACHLLKEHETKSKGD